MITGIDMSATVDTCFVDVRVELDGMRWRAEYSRTHPKPAKVNVTKWDGLATCNWTLVAKGTWDLENSELVCFAPVPDNVVGALNEALRRVLGVS